MAPQSDVDLLFLTPYKITPWAESVIESMLYILVGSEAEGRPRQPHDQRLHRLGREDYTIRTPLWNIAFLRVTTAWPSWEQALV